MSPFKSERQRKWMWKNKPELAKEFAHAEELKKRRASRKRKKKSGGG